MKRIVSIIIVVVLVATFTIYSAVAVPAPSNYGDINNNYDVDIFDASLIQRYVAELEAFNKLQMKLGDVDNDGEVTIMDATFVQRKVAKIIKEFPNGNLIYTYVNSCNVCTNFDSSMAMVNEPVKILYSATGTFAPFTYNVYVNDELVIENLSDTEYEHVFTEPGEYLIQVEAVNTLGVSHDSKKIRYKVVEPYDTENPVICGVYYSPEYLQWGYFTEVCKNVKLNVNVIGGTQPYEYRYTFHNGTDTPIVKEYSSDNTFVFEGQYEIGDYSLDIEVKDALGNTVKRTIPIEVSGARVG